MSYKVQGLNQLEAALKELGARSEKKVLKQSLRDASKPVIKEIRSSIPKKSGELRKSIGSKITKGGRLIIGYRMGKKYRGFIGKFLEEGTKGHLIKPRKGRKAIATPYGLKKQVYVKGIKANPILAKAFERSHKTALEIFKRRLKERMILESIRKGGR